MGDTLVLNDAFEVALDFDDDGDLLVAIIDDENVHYVAYLSMTQATRLAAVVIAAVAAREAGDK